MGNEKRVYTVTKWQAFAIVTAIIVAALSVPVGVMAATGSFVNIRDYATTGASGYSRVINNRIVTEQCDPGTTTINTTTCSRVTGGKLQVGAQPVAPANPWNAINDISLTASGSRRPLYIGLGPARLNLSNFTASAEGGTAGSVRIFLIVYVSDSSAGDCTTLSGASFGAAERFVVMVPVGSTISLSYPTPLVYSAYASSGRRYCVDVETSGPSGYTAHVSGVGFIG
ncbi:MAG: hypothetical protein QOK42_695 [Frankiaceae bacterium]|nr:hypothetical protein [Frankiaceae bacterium]